MRVLPFILLVVKLMEQQSFYYWEEMDEEILGLHKQDIATSKRDSEK